MSALSGVVYATAVVTGATALGRAVRPGAVVLCYHNVVDRPVLAADVALHLPVAEFAGQMEWLARYFSIISLDELRERARAGRSLRGCASVTFDDAYQGTIAHGLRVLGALGAPSTVFVPSAAPASGDAFWWDLATEAARDAERRQYFVEDLAGDAAAIRAELGSSAEVESQCLPASWGQLRAVASDLVALGAHSVTHRTLPQLDDRALERELRECRIAISSETDVEPRWFAYPYGRWNERTASAVRAAGYEGAWTLDAQDVSRGCDWFGAPRVNIPAGLRLGTFDAWVSGFAHLRSRVGR